jgi:release factor glutamine methyltransferase
MTTATIGGLRRTIAERLRPAGDNAALEARLLVAHAVGREAARLPLADDTAVDREEEARALAYAGRRLAGEPVARITGRKEFWGLDFLLSPETLVPRPDTETVVEAALAFARDAGGPLTILDLGTGSGAILLALLSELPEATGIGVDRSAGAAATASRNAERLGLAGRARFFVGDWGAALRGHFDLVLGNPPYVESAVIETLPVDVKAHDPLMALDGGRDGLDAYRSIFAGLEGLLAPGGRAFLEIGAGQGQQIADIAEELSFAVRFHRDLASIERVAELSLGETGAELSASARARKNVLGKPARNG